MTVFVSQYSDMILSALCSALLWTGMNCIALSKEKSDREQPFSWLSMGVAMLILAAREWVGILAVADTVTAWWYPLGAIMMTAASLCVLLAVGKPGARSALPVRILAGILLLVLIGLIAHPLIAAPVRPDGGGFISSAMFFLSKISFCLVCGVVLLRALPSSGLRGTGLVAALFLLHAIVIAVCDPPGMPDSPSALAASANRFMISLWLFRVCVAFAAAVATWNLYARAMGVEGGVHWWPAMLLGLVLASGFACVALSASAYSGALRQSSDDALRIMREVYLFKNPLLLILPLAFLLSLLLIARQQSAWLKSRAANRAEALRQGALSNDLAGVLITAGPGLDTPVVDANRRLLDMLGLNREELVGRSAGTAFTPAPPRGGKDGAPGGAGVPHSSFETSFTRRDGMTVHLMVFGRPLAPGAPEGGHVWESIDITRIREMENEVRRANERFQMIVDTLPEAIFVKSPSGRYLMANKAFGALFGIPDGRAIVGKKNLEGIHGPGSGNASINDDICRDMHGKTLVYDQALVIDGTPRYFEFSKTMRWFGDDDSNFVIIGSVHDLTARKRAENAIDAERHFLHQVLSTLPVAVCFVDRERRVRICDEDFSREAGFGDADDVIGMHFDEINPFGPSDRGEDERLLAAGEGRNDNAFEISSGREGPTRHFMLRRTVMSSPGGEVLGLVKAYWDTTALVSANRAAQQAERAKMAFLANMSHELRTPMNGIVGMADLIIDHQSTEPLQRLHAETIIRSAKTLQMVMDEVMDVATLTDGSHRFEVHPAPFPLLYLSEEAAQIVSCIIEAWGVELSLNYDFNLQTMYSGDARHIRQILVQILTHTSRLTRDKRLRLEVAGVGSLEDERVAFRVIFKPADDIDTQSIDDMFKHPRHTSEETRSAINLGIFNDRIGLPLTWRLIEAMGGSLSVTRQFRDIRCEVVLPMSSREQGPHPIAAPDLSGISVLVGANIPERTLTAKKCYEYARADVHLADTAEAVRLRLRAAKEKGKLFGQIFLDGSLVPQEELAGFIAEVRGFYGGEKNGANIMLVVSPRQVQSLQLEAAAVKSLILPPVCPSELWYKADMMTAGGLPEPAARARRRSTRVERVVRVQARVLLVEDNSVNQMVAMGILKRIGCQPVLAKDGAEAVDMIARQGLRFDLILMDCMMPVMDGYEATTHIRLFEKSGGADAERNIIVALTANSLAGDRERCLASGMDDYMTKPVTLDQVRDCLLKHCPKLATMIDTSREAEGAAG